VHVTTVDVVQAAVAQWLSATAALTVESHVPKLSPEIVSIEPPEVAPFKRMKLTTAESKVNGVCCVPMIERTDKVTGREMPSPDAGTQPTLVVESQERVGHNVSPNAAEVV